jgi:hypothetical protein
MSLTQNQAVSPQCPPGLFRIEENRWLWLLLFIGFVSLYAVIQCLLIPTGVKIVSEIRPNLNVTSIERFVRNASLTQALIIRPILMILEWLFISYFIWSTHLFLYESLLPFSRILNIVAVLEVCTFAKRICEILILWTRGFDAIRSLSDLQPKMGLDLLVKIDSQPLNSVIGLLNPFELLFVFFLWILLEKHTRFSEMQSLAVGVGYFVIKFLIFYSVTVLVQAQV